MESTYRHDKRKHPQIVKFRYMTTEECRALKQGESVACIDVEGKLATVKVTSIKRWKTRSDIEVRWKFGMRQYGAEPISDDEQQTFFVVVETDAVKEMRTFVVKCKVDPQFTVEAADEEEAVREAEKQFASSFSHGFPFRPDWEITAEAKEVKP